MTQATTISREQIQRTLIQNPNMVRRELFRRSYFEFFKYFWSEISADELILNWHHEYLCNVLQRGATLVGENKPREHDILINISPGETKTALVMKLFPVWCWTQWFHFRFITASYSQILSLESGEASRDLIRSEKFREVYPELAIKDDKDVKTNYRITKTVNGKIENGGNRFSTSVGGSVIGFHGHINIVDDPLNPNDSVSSKKLESTNHWMDNVISTRKVNKDVTLTIVIQQRLHQNDPSGHLLSKKKKNILHICLPGTLDDFAEFVNPPELAEYYIDGLMNPARMNREILKELEVDLGQYGYSAQIGQNPVPPGGGMFRVDQVRIASHMPPDVDLVDCWRYWDKAGTKDGGAYTVGVKMYKLVDGRFFIADVVRGQWSTDEREKIILQTAKADGTSVNIAIEQEPGSGGKESAESTIRNLSGFRIFADRPTGDKVFRADPYSVQVNNGNVVLLHGDWNADFIEEHRFFPLGKYKDQVDAAAAAFNKLVSKKIARAL